MSAASNIPTGRRGRYVCPICGHVELQEELMIDHRLFPGRCLEVNLALRGPISDRALAEALVTLNERE